MTRNLKVNLIMLLFAIFAFACSDSGSDETTPGDGDQDATETESDGDEAECDCQTEDACCDGCQAINEGGACNDGNACTQTDTCSNGTCSGGNAVVCTELDNCHDVGECDPETGECSQPMKADNTVCSDDNPCTQLDVCLEGVCTGSDPVLCEASDCQTGGVCDESTGKCVFTNAENGLSCEAIADTSGSGVCLNGSCEGFGACDSRNYGQPDNYPCNTDAECESGFCYDLGNDWQTICTRPCADDATVCTNGMTCRDTLSDPAFICLPPGEEDWIGNMQYETAPGDGSLDIYDACNTNEDCAGALCLSLGGKKFCTTDCGSGDSVCGDCGDCRNNGDDLGFPYDNFCSATGDQAFGQACELPFDCASRVCFNNYCSDQCWIISEGIDTCDEGFACVYDAYQQGVGICVADDELDHPAGSPCEGDYECESGLCYDVAGNPICAIDCFDGTDCPTDMSCVDGDPMLLDTTLRLYPDGSDEVLRTDYDSGYEAFSRISYSFSDAGTYVIEITGADEFAEGLYQLVVAPSGSELTATDEKEPNNTFATAQEIVYPVIVHAFLEAEETDVYSITVGDDAPITLIIETIPELARVCVADDVAGQQGYGDTCEDDFQCEAGLFCLFLGVCTNECESDADCEDGLCVNSTLGPICVPESGMHQTIDGRACALDFECREVCFADNALETYYCSGACESDGDCVPGMGCYQGMCIKGVNGNQMLHSYCRIDNDCETGYCQDYQCSTLCGDSADCEGSTLITPEEYGICWPCETNADCNEDGGETPNTCVSVSNGSKFCGTDCSSDPSVCPYGTRCHALNIFGQAACAPVSLSCDTATACTDGGYCLRPFLGAGSVCKDNAECISGICSAGFCQDGTCSDDADCGCDYLSCEGSVCSANTDDALEEVEPNDLPENAQDIGDGDETVLASMLPDGTIPDTDIYSISLDSGQVLDIRTSSFCGEDADTFLRLLDSRGNILDGWENDDFSQSNYFSYLRGFAADTSQSVLIEVSQSSYVDGVLRAPYVLDVLVTDQAANDTCDGASTLGDIPIEDDLSGLTNAFDASGCTGASMGLDRVYSIAVPAQNALYLQLDSDFNGTMYLLSSCEDSDSACLTGVNANAGSGVEILDYVNDTDTEVTLYLVIDSAMGLWGEQEYLISAMTEPLAAPANDQASGAIAIESSGHFEGSTGSATNDYDPGETGCLEAAQPGPDVVYSVNMNSLEFFAVSLNATFNASMYLVTDHTDLSTCVAHGVKNLTYEFGSKDDSQTLYLIIDGSTAEDSGFFLMDVILDESGDCYGPCDSDEHNNICVAGDGSGNALCQCNGTTGLYSMLDCNQYCLDNGTLSGACRTQTTDTSSNSGCVCNVDCASVASQCANYDYTNCTCAEADPCGWQGDTYCDELCETLYPDDFFDDSADCSSE